MKNKVFIIILILLFSSLIFAQRPPRGGGQPPFPQGQPPFPQGQPPFPQGQPPMQRNENQPKGQPEWAKIIDVNGNKRIEREEYRVAANEFFSQMDKNNNGILEESELPLPPRQNQVPPMQNQDKGKKVPPFLFLKPEDTNLNKEQFDEKSNLRFIEYDMNGDGAINLEEVKNVRPVRFNNPHTATAQFIGAEMRFGDKVVKNAPFSAETVRSENKRLYDGALIKNESKGLIYRDGEGRTRQEQPLEMIGGYKVFGDDNQPKRMINIVDVVKGDFYSLDSDNKEAHKVPLLQNSPIQPKEPQEAKKESLGTRKFDGVNAEGTKITVEIPIGQIGNDKPIYVITEKWFSPELQMVVYSKHTDPFIGEVTFQLVNIKIGEPSAELFKIPSNYKVIEPPKRKGDDE
jgi:Ca2+-binding EF-hand superfamily protein